MARDPKEIQNELDQMNRKVQELKDELAAATGGQPSEAPRPGATKPESIGPIEPE